MCLEVRSMKEKTKIFVNERQFDPKVIGLLINPFYFARKGLIENIKSVSGYIKGKTLDVGCGNKPYENLFHSSEYLGLEINHPANKINNKHKKADYLYDGKIFPFPDGEFDSVVTNQVFEHIFNPDNFLTEINRVMKNEGILLMTVPFVWDEHEQPFDYARYSSFGLKHILNQHGFEVLEYKKSMSDIRIIFQLINAYIYKNTVTTNNYINLLLTILLMSPFNILGELLSKILPENDDLYLDNIVLARKRKSYE